MNWEVMEAGLREVWGAYVQALERGDFESALFWRRIVIERLVVVRGYLKDSR